MQLAALGLVTVSVHALSAHTVAAPPAYVQGTELVLVAVGHSVAPLAVVTV